MRSILVCLVIGLLTAPFASGCGGGGDGDADADGDGDSDGDGDGDGGLQQGFEEELTVADGCSDAFFYFCDGADTVVLQLYVPGLVQEAIDAGEPRTTVIDPLVSGDDGPQCTVSVGQRVTAALCTDVVVEDPAIQQTWIATSGHATITINPGDTPPSSRGDVLLEDVVFTATDGSGDTVTVDTFEATDVPVGGYIG